MQIILCLLLFFSAAEKKKEIEILPVPFDTVSQSISISKTIAVQPLYNADSTLDTVYAKDIYLSAMNWFHLNYPSPKKVIQSTFEPDSIIGKYKFRVYYINPKTGARNVIKHWIMYDIKIETYKASYTYTIDNFRTDEATPQHIERWLDKNNRAKKEYAMYTNQLVEYLNTLEQSIVEKMKLIDSK